MVSVLHTKSTEGELLLPPMGCAMALMSQRWGITKVRFLGRKSEIIKERGTLMKTVYEEIFEELADCDYNGFVRNYEAEKARQEEKRYIEKLEIEAETYRTLYKKLHIKYARLLEQLEKRGISL